MSAPELQVVEDPAQAVADLMLEIAEAGGHIVLTGGSSPKRAYELAASRRLDWSRATIWFGDERCVPPQDERSNFGMADAAMLSQLDPAPSIHRMQGELGPDPAAGAYEAEGRNKNNWALQRLHQ